MEARPILDIDVVIRTRDELPPVTERLSTLGYEHLGDLGIAGREAFSGKGVPQEDSGRRWPAHNLYVCASDSEELTWHLAFRDYLRAHPEAVQIYGQIKREQAKRHPSDMDAYLQGKAFFIQGCLRAAQEAAGPLPDAPPGRVAREITAYYGKNAEEARLTKESGQLEIARIQELLRFYHRRRR